MSKSTRRSVTRGRDAPRHRYPVPHEQPIFDRFMVRDHLATYRPTIYVTPDSTEDRRLWTPETVPTAGTLSGRPARFGLPPYRPPSRSALLGAAKRSARALSRSELLKLYEPTHRIGFQKPKSVHVCVRRYLRRKVLHALGIAGQAARLFRRRRTGPFSSISCR